MSEASYSNDVRWCSIHGNLHMHSFTSNLASSGSSLRKFYKVVDHGRSVYSAQ